jgi:uncharacterized protein YlxW (UPF0749 family)
MKKGQLSIGLVCILLGVILSIQFKTVSETVGEGVLPTQRAQQLAADLKKLQKDRDDRQKELDTLESKIKQYEKGESDNNSYTEGLYNELEKYRTLAGYIDMKGPGVIFEIDDPPMDVQFGQGNSIVYDTDIIIQIISILNSADAEAISINDQRYTSFTEIVQANDHLEINGVSVGPPIVIKAIGDPSVLESALSIKGGIKYYLENNTDYKVQLKQDQNVSIPKYRKIKNFTFAKPVQETAN